MTFDLRDPERVCDGILLEGIRIEMLPSVILKSGREKAPLRRHPWIFDGAIEKNPEVEPGAIVDVRDSHNSFIARGYYNLASQIRVRLLTWNENETIDAAFWRHRLEESIARRERLSNPKKTTACRLVHAEADRLPGLIVDHYGDWLVVQALTAGIEAQLKTIVEHLMNLVSPTGIVERSDEGVRKLEGLEPRSGIVSGEPPPAAGIEIEENGLRFIVNVLEGHKTGFYLDQRENRAILANLVTKDHHVLDCFSYTGGFSVVAASRGAASVTSVDSSGPALSLLERNMHLNGLAERSHDIRTEGNASEILRKLRTEKRRFDIIVLDPPKFAINTGQIESACRAYKDINLQAFHLLKAGGYLMTFSCSGLVSADLFQKVVFGASLDAQVEAQILRPLAQADDHPVLLTFPESAYLKGLLCRKIS